MGILRQSRKQRALARDECERRELRWLATTQIAGTLAFMIAMQVGVFMDGAWLPILCHVLFSAVILVQEPLGPLNRWCSRPGTS